MPYRDSSYLTEYWEELLAVAPKKIPLEPVLEEGDELLTIETAFEAVSFSDPDYDAVVKAVNEAPEYLKVLTIDVTYNEITFKISETLGIRLAELSGAVSMQPFGKGVNNSCKVVFTRPTSVSTSFNFYAMYHYLMTTYFKSCFVDLKRNVKTESFRVLIDISKDLNILLNTLKSDFEQRVYLRHNNRRIFPEELTQYVVERSRSLLLNSRLSAANLTVEGVSEPLVRYYRATRAGIGLPHIIPLNPEEVINVELIAKEGNSINVHFHTLETQIKGKKKVEMGIGAFITKYCAILGHVGNTELLNKVIEDLSNSVHMYMNRLKITTEITDNVYFGYFHGNYTKIETGGELYNSCMRGDISSKVCHNYYTKFIKEGLLDFVVQKDFEGNVAGRVFVWKDNPKGTIYVDRYYPGISSMKNSIVDTIEGLYKGKQIYNTGRDDLRTNFNKPEAPLAVRCDFMIDFFRETLCDTRSNLHTSHIDSSWYYSQLADVNIGNFYNREYGSSFSKFKKTTKEGAQAFGELLMSSGLVINTQSTSGSKFPYMDSFSRLVIIGNKCWLLSNTMSSRIISALDTLRSKNIFSKQENKEMYYLHYLQKYGPAEEITKAVEEAIYKTFKQYKTIIINE